MLSPREIRTFGQFSGFRSQDGCGGVAAAPAGVLPPLPGLPAKPAPHLQDLQQRPAAKCLRQGVGTLSSHLRLAKSEEYVVKI